MNRRSFIEKIPLVTIGFVLVGCGVDEDILQEEEFKTAEAKAYTPWQKKESIYQISPNGSSVNLGTFKLGAKAQVLIDKSFGGQLLKWRDQPKFSNQWFLNKKGRNPYALIKVASSTEVETAGGTSFHSIEGFKYLFVHTGKVKNITITGVTDNGFSFYEPVELKRKRILHYQ